MREHAYKFVDGVKKDGVIHTMNRVFAKLIRLYRMRRQPLQTMVRYDDLLRADYRKRAYKPKKIPPKDKLKIAWILSPLSAGSGGLNTIGRFIRHLESKGHINKIYLYEGIDSQSIDKANEILEVYFPKIKAKCAKLEDYKECDLVFATGWETAYPLLNLKTKAAKFYFIQDFEPYFYAAGSRTALATNTYKFGFHGITAGKWLSKKLKNEFNMDCDYFDFGTDKDIYKYQNKKPRKQVCFYARPVTERRAFELGVVALDIFHRKHPEYEIHMFGWDVSSFKLPFPYVNQGVLSHEELNLLYNDSIACLVLSLTNASLLPNELLASGCIPVMNEGENNKLVVDNKFVQYTDLTVHGLANGLSEVVERKDALSYSQEASKSVASHSWAEAGERVEKAIKKELFL